mgnify:CR=1 FL=1
MANYKIHGGKKLRGVAETKTAKNSAISLMCASLLTTEPITLKEVPKIQDVIKLENVLKSIGVKIKREGRNMTLTAPKKLTLSEIDFENATKLRAILFLIGCLAHRYKNFKIPRAGGCKLGKRTITPHLFGFERFGLKIIAHMNHYEIKRNKKLTGKKIVMYESGDTSTENMILGAVLASGRTIIKFASANYMVQDLCHMLKSMGAKISNIGSTTLIIDGVKKLHGTSYYIMPDPIESMFWL